MSFDGIFGEDVFENKCSFVKSFINGEDYEDSNKIISLYQCNLPGFETIEAIAKDKTLEISGERKTKMKVKRDTFVELKWSIKFVKTFNLTNKPDYINVYQKDSSGIFNVEVVEKIDD